jgi:hypothetical protein
MWHGSSSAKRKYIDKQYGQPVECFCLPWGLKQKAVTTPYPIKCHINKNLQRVSEEFFGMIKERERERGREPWPDPPRTFFKPFPANAENMVSA